MSKDKIPTALPRPANADVNAPPAPSKFGSMINAMSGMLKFNLKGTAFADCFSTKYITAQIFDDLNGWLVFPLKQSYIIDGKFILKLGEQLLVLRVDMDKIQTYRHKAARPVQTVLYTTKDIDPLDLNDNATIEAFCVENDIEQIDHIQGILIQAVHLLAEQGAQNGPVGFSEALESILSTFEPNSLEYTREKAKYAKAINAISVEHLIGPTAPICKYLGRNMRNNPITIGNILVLAKSIEHEWKEIANPAKSPFKHWMLLLGLLGGISVIGIAAWFFMGGDPMSQQQDLIEAIQSAEQAGLQPDEVWPENDGPAPAPADPEPNTEPDLFDGISDFTTGVLTP